MDLEILDPKFANFSGPVPMALTAETLEEEIAYARRYAATVLRTQAEKQSWQLHTLPATPPKLRY